MPGTERRAKAQQGKGEIVPCLYSHSEKAACAAWLRCACAVQPLWGRRPAGIGMEQGAEHTGECGPHPADYRLAGRCHLPGRLWPGGGPHQRRSDGGEGARKWDESFEAFHAVVQQSGLTLEKCKGKQVDKWTVPVPALCDDTKKTYAVVLVYKNEPQGAYLLEKPSGEVKALAPGPKQRRADAAGKKRRPPCLAQAAPRKAPPGKTRRRRPAR